LRVVLVSHHGLPHVGGVEVIVDQEVRALAEAGHEIVHVTSNATGSGDVGAVPELARRVQVRAWHAVERRAHLAFPLFGPALFTTLRREIARADVVHCHGFIYQTTAAAMAAARWAGVPRILTDHGAIQRYHSRAATVSAFAAAHSIGRVACVLADRVIAYNDRILDVLIRLASPRRPDARFIPYPVRPFFRPPSPEERREARAALSVSDDVPIVAYAGRLNPDKGADLVAALGVDSSWKIIICGPGDRAVLGPLGANVKLLPPTDALGVLSVFHAADVVVAPTVPGREGFPLVVREALASGTPVVSSYEEGYRRYRQISGLHFVDRELSSLRAGVMAALAGGRVIPPTDSVFNPSPTDWIESVYGGLACASAHHRRETARRLNACARAAERRS
jgi:glycosyltransferase involved in cell wall biosynthesis